MRILVLGATGMLGNAVFKVFGQDQKLETWGTLRSAGALRHFSEESRTRLLPGIDVLDQDVLIKVLERVRPEVVVNCVGLIKQLVEAGDPLTALPINAILPHRLVRLCSLLNARLIHISTDCVFSGRRGGYLESDESDARDLYGKSKHIGELQDMPGAVTLRTSIIGHELNSNFALLEWFLSQQGKVQGFSKAIFSGLPTIELAHVMKNFVLPNPNISGLYHVTAEPISKFDLLRLVAAQYGKKIEILPDDSLVIDRSLNGELFNHATGYKAPKWEYLIAQMHSMR